MSSLFRGSKRPAPAALAPDVAPAKPPESKTDGSKRALIAAGVGCGLFLLLVGIKLALSPAHHSRIDDQPAQKPQAAKPDTGQADFSDSLSGYRQQQEAARRRAQEQAAKQQPATTGQSDNGSITAEEATFIRQAWRGSIAIKDARPDAPQKTVDAPVPGPGAASTPAIVDPELQRQLNSLDKRLGQGGVR